MYVCPPPPPPLPIQPRILSILAALESTRMSPTLGQILVGNSPTPGQILAGISPTAGTKL